MSSRPPPPGQSYSFDYQQGSSYQPYRKQGGYQVSSASALNSDVNRSYTASPAEQRYDNHTYTPPYQDTSYSGQSQYRQQPRPQERYQQGYNEYSTEYQSRQQPQQRYDNYSSSTAYPSHQRQQQPTMPNIPKKPLPSAPSMNTNSSANSIPAAPTQNRGVDDRPRESRRQEYHDPPSRPRPAAAAGALGGAAYVSSTDRSRSPARYGGDDYYQEQPEPSPYHSDFQSYPPSPPRHGHVRNKLSNSSTTGLAAAPASPGLAPVDTSSSRGGSRQGTRPSWDRSYSDQQERPEERGRNLGAIDPMEIADDEDEAFTGRKQKRKSRLSPFGASATGAGAGGAAGNFVKGLTSRDTSGNYGQIPGGNSDKKEAENSEWLDGQSRSNKKLKWMVGGLIATVIILAIVGGVVGVIISRNKSSGGVPGADGNDFTADSSQVQDLLNNSELHKVFPGMDYTPYNTQYPGCLDNPPSQNNVTMDVAVLSQLTPVIRLYGTDCKQTEMVLKAIDILGLGDSIKVWLGVWQDNNATTNARQLSQLYDVLDNYDASSFLGIIVGNEVLFRKEMSVTQLSTVLSDVRSEVTKRGLDLAVTTSDLGSDWTPQLVQAADVVMGNIHPFFAGIAVDGAADWTYNFWQSNDVYLTRNLPNKKNLISEVGWPSGGGHRCANDQGIKIPCTAPGQGSVAGIDEMNQFMQDWVCTSLANGTDYFWFEAFDEPWKVVYNTPTEQWEDKWGLMDAARNLKSGLTIPDCGGQTASLPQRKRAKRGPWW